MKLPAWIGSFQEEEIKRNVVVYSSFMLSVLPTKNQDHSRVIMMNSHFISENELDSLRLGRDFGSVKL